MKRLLNMSVLLFTTFSMVWAQGGLVYETKTVKSEILKMERKYAVYLPPGYNESDQIGRASCRERV